MSFGEHVARIYGGLDWRTLVLAHGMILAALCHLAHQLVRAAAMKRRLCNLEAKVAQRLEEFRDTLEKMSQNGPDIGRRSFDTSVSAVLEHTEAGPQAARSPSRAPTELDEAFEELWMEELGEGTTADSSEEDEEGGARPSRAA